MNDYVLADDLSGALEAGVAFGAAGRRVILPLRDDADVEGEALTVFSTETRNAAPADAAAVVRRLLARQHGRGACMRFKKIDSTLRGPVAAELDALVAELEPSLVVFCPANPLTGRTISGGHLMVHGVPLEKTEFRHDPHWPMRTGDIPELLSMGRRRRPIVVQRADLHANSESLFATVRKESGGPVVLVPDVESMEDMGLLVAAGSGMGSDVVWVGSGALAKVLAGQSGLRSESSVSPPALVINGSRSPVALRQIAAIKDEHDAVVVELAMNEPLTVQVSRVVKAIEHHRIIALSFLLPEGTADAAMGLQVWIANLVQSLITCVSLGMLYLTGGETARQVCRTLRGKSMEILGEIETGVVLGLLTREQHGPMYIVTKPGGYGDDLSISRHIKKIMK